MDVSADLLGGSPADLVQRKGRCDSSCRKWQPGFHGRWTEPVDARSLARPESGSGPWAGTSPTREALIDALYRDQADGSTYGAVQLLATLPPRGDHVDWCARLAGRTLLLKQAS